VPEGTENRRIARDAATVMIAIILGQVFSLLSSILITNAFGTGIANEAFNASNRLPDILYQLVAGGALASAFIPTFTTLLTRGEREKAWKLASAIASIITLHLHSCRCCDCHLCSLGCAPHSCSWLYRTPKIQTDG